MEQLSDTLYIIWLYFITFLALSKQTNKTDQHSWVLATVTNSNTSKQHNTPKKNCHRVPAFAGYLFCFSTKSSKGVFARLTPNPFMNLSMSLSCFFVSPHCVSFALLVLSQSGAYVYPSVLSCYDWLSCFVDAESKQNCTNTSTNSKIVTFLSFG